MDNTRVARAAGILEGEGCFRTLTGRHAPSVVCQMTDLDVLEELLDLFGGTLHSTKTAKAHYKPTWKWQVQGDLAEQVMLAVRPYMFDRRTQAIDAALEVWDARKLVKQEIRERGEAAARSYLKGEGSLRAVAKQFHCNYETVRTHAIRLGSVV